MDAGEIRKGEIRSEKWCKKSAVKWMALTEPEAWLAEPVAVQHCPLVTLHGLRQEQDNHKPHCKTLSTLLN